MMYNLAIIGGGPAGYTAAQMAQNAGWKVVLFEGDTLGGTCLNVGCIPTKTLLYSVKQYHNAMLANKYGISVENIAFDLKKMQQRKQKVVRKLVAGIKASLKDCTIVGAIAKVVSRTDDKVVLEAEGEQYEAEKLLICTGSNNFVPPIEGISDNPFVLDSTSALNLQEIPQSMVIVGGGVIGMEFATLFGQLGTKITIVEAMQDILPQLDQDVVDLLKEKYVKQGIEILTNTKVERIDRNIVFTNNEQKPQIEAEKILVCVGRRANLRGLEALEDIELERGAIKVNDFMQTNLKNVYAAGDVTGKIMLAHVASRQAEVAVGRMLKQIPLQRIAYNAIPSVVYTNPEIASVGLTEKQVSDFYKEMEGIDAYEQKGGGEAFYEVKSLPMSFSGRFVAENEGENGLCKVIVDKRNQTILGVHAVGNPASEFIAVASFAVRMGYTISEFKQVVFPHPTVSEILRETIMAI